MEKNKIITISGQPVTGKGTTVKRIIDKLKEQGYSEENIHIITAGNEFREYFESIYEFIKKYTDTEQVEYLKENEKLRVFFEKKEYRDILINTIIELRKSDIDINKLTITDALSLKELKALRVEIDNIIDSKIENIGREINSVSRPNEIWIIDSRLAFHNIPESFAVRLTSNPQVAAERYFNDKSRKKEDSYGSVEEAYEAREERRKAEQSGYIKRYGVDLEDEDNYNLIIDTSYSTTEDISDTILICLDYYIDNKFFSKKWASPKTFLPLQRELDTLKLGGMYSLEEMEQIINEEGYDPSSAISVVEVDGIKYIIEGHHRNFATSKLKKTLIPYEIIARDDEELPFTKQTARERANSVKCSYLWYHEEFIDKDFHYEEIYPNIFNMIKERDAKEGR